MKTIPFPQALHILSKCNAVLVGNDCAAVPDFIPDGFWIEFPDDDPRSPDELKTASFHLEENETVEIVDGGLKFLTRLKKSYIIQPLQLMEVK